MIYAPYMFVPSPYSNFLLHRHTLNSPMKKKGGVAIPFPLKLHELLEKVDEEGKLNLGGASSYSQCFK